MGKIFTYKMVHYGIVKMTSQLIQLSTNKKDHPSHTRQVQINLFKLTRWSFWHLSKWDPSWLDFLVKITYFYSSELWLGKQYPPTLVTSYGFHLEVGNVSKSNRKCWLLVGMLLQNMELGRKNCKLQWLLK